MTRIRVIIEVDNVEEFYVDKQIKKKGNLKRILEDAYKQIKDKLNNCGEGLSERR